MKKGLLFAALVVALVFAFTSAAFAATAITATTSSPFSLVNGSDAAISATFTCGTETTTTPQWRVRIQRADQTTITAADLAALTVSLNGSPVAIDQVVLGNSNVDTFAVSAWLPSTSMTGVAATETLTVAFHGQNDAQYSAVVSLVGNKGNVKAAAALPFSWTAGITPAPAGSGQAPTVSDPVTGLSVFTYRDLADISAGVTKTEGGYAAFQSGLLYTGGANGKGPHGGYDSSTNKCKVCHAVHRAEGAYYLLRSDSQDDACDYCHIGGTAHSAKVVYDLNAAGTATTNGHTIGAMTEIPDSTTKQVAQNVTISTTDGSGNAVSATIKVRSYDSAANEMFRLTRHHAQSPVGTGRSGWKKVGPYALRCMNCHQPHNATAQIWNPQVYDNTLTADTAATGAGYKLLRKYPSGSTVGQANSYGMFDSGQAVKVPETNLVAGTNYSTNMSGEKTYTENGVTAAQPVWVAQGWDLGAGTGPSEDPATVNQYTLSVWCADCHNLNIGGAIEFESRGIADELGFKAHTERTHPAPFVGAHTGPGQCYSCHRDDLSVVNGVADPAGYGSAQAAAPAMPASANCTQCHYGTQAYYYDHAEAPGATRDSDFPHSGKSSDIKMLGSYTARVANNSSYQSVAGDFSFATITETNLDAVCIRCHPGIGVHN